MIGRDKKGEKIQSVRGMKDQLPDESIIWKYVEDTLKLVLSKYGYSEVRLPIIERTSLFRRAIGEVTDVVEKEMYSFKDRNGESLTLRPEGTIGCLRAAIEHGLVRDQEQRLWYIGPMFRHERPQRGRYRQFHQLGVETIGLQGPSIDAELIMLAFRWWRVLGITNYISLELNSIGSIKERSRYCCALVAYLEKHKEKLDESCKRRIYSNPLRILDSKNPNIQSLLNDAPVLLDYLSNDQQEHFSELCKLLKDVGISYTVNRHLVRGLDYYNHTVFEWTSTKIGAKSTVCAGGRYDGLIEKMCGYASPAVGFAVGIERLILLIQTVKPFCNVDSDIDIYLVTHGKNVQSSTMKLAEYIRDALPDIKIKIDHKCGSVKKQFTLADKCGASIVLILDNSEIKSDNVIIKDLRSGKRTKIVQNEVVSYLRTLSF